MVGIRTSQKSTIFYSKLQGTAHPYTEQEKFIQKAVFRKIVLTEPLDSHPFREGDRTTGSGLGPEGGFDLDSFRLCAAVTLRLGQGGHKPPLPKATM